MGNFALQKKNTKSAVYTLVTVKSCMQLQYSKVVSARIGLKLLRIFLVVVCITNDSDSSKIVKSPLTSLINQYVCSAKSGNHICKHKYFSSLLYIHNLSDRNLWVWFLLKHLTK